MTLAVMLLGCGGGGDNPTGTLRVAMTDASGPYADVVVAVKDVRVVPTGWASAPTGPRLPSIVAFSPSQIVAVLTLAFTQLVLGEAVVPAGSYAQVRLVLEPNPTTGDPVNYVTLDSDPLTKIPLDTPSGQQSGLKILGPFTVTAGEINAIALDFDPSRAIVQNGASGHYTLKPTGIRIVQMANVLPTYGSLSGSVGPAAAWPTAVVSVYPLGSTVPIAAGSVDPLDGAFRAFVPAGDYTVRVSASGFAPFDSLALVPPVSYDVSLGADTAVGDIVLTP